MAAHSDVSCLSKPFARSQVGSHFPNNGAVLNISKILTAMVSSAAKGKLGSLYINTCEAIQMQQIGHSAFDVIHLYKSVS